MSEEIIKNQPGAAGDLGATAPGLYQGQGAFASGGIGGVSNPGADTLGNIPTATLGSTSGANAVNPSGSAASGILRPEQARRFIDYVWDATVLAKDGRRVTMKANSMELEKVNVGERVIRAAAQAVGNYTNTGATFSKVELTTKKIRLDWEVTAESLEDGVEGDALEDHLVRLMTNAFANDIEDLAINGDGATGAFLSIMPGFINKVKTNNDAHESVVTVADNAWTPNVCPIPSRYDWRFAWVDPGIWPENASATASASVSLRITVHSLMQLQKHSQARCQDQPRQTASHTLMVSDRHSVEHVQLVFSESKFRKFLTTQQAISI